MLSHTEAYGSFAYIYQPHLFVRVADHALALDCARHALMFFNSPDLDLRSARPGSFAIMPSAEMLDVLKRDYQVMLGMIFGEVPEFSDVLDAVKKLEDEINQRRD
jgi:hypothetical protein